MADESQTHMIIMGLLGLSIVLLLVHLYQMRKEQYSTVIAKDAVVEGNIGYAGLDQTYLDAIKNQQQFYSIVNPKGVLQNAFVGPLDANPSGVSLSQKTPDNYWSAENPK